ncbi:class I SAM-dependent methyltransferase [Aquirufa sp. ROCK2-A2]
MIDSWNDRYKQDAFQYGTEPNDYFKAQIDQLPVGRILIPAAGEGRDAVYAAKLGWEVYAFDSSERGRDKAIQLAKNEKVSIYYTVEDALKIRYPLESFDAIAFIYFHLPPEIRCVFHQISTKWLKNNGVVILEGFNYRQLALSSGGPKNKDWLFDSVILRNDFDPLLILENTEKQRILNEGPLHQGIAEVIQFKATKLKNSSHV